MTPGHGLADDEPPRDAVVAHAADDVEGAYDDTPKARSAPAARGGLFAEYTELRNAVWALKISSPQAYLSAIERGELKRAPLQPERVYLASWRGWKDLLWCDDRQADVDGVEVGGNVLPFDDMRRQMDAEDSANEYFMLGYWDAVFQVWLRRIGTKQHYRDAVSGGILRDCPCHPDRFYRQCWSSWEEFLWAPGKTNPMVPLPSGDEGASDLASQESVAQIVWAHRTSTPEGYRAAVAAGALPGAPMAPDKAWLNFCWNGFLWPRSGTARKG